jgi:4-hydroxythreonine-4-phosphate dehydrogenase
MGDYNGIGPEVVLKSIRSASVTRICSPLLVGSPDVFAHYARGLGFKMKFETGNDLLSSSAGSAIRVIQPGGALPSKIKPGKVSRESGAEAARALRLALGLCIGGRVEGMVTAPVSKEAMFLSGYRHPGQTEFLAARTHARSSAMLLIANSLRVSLATVHLPLREVASALSAGLILTKLKVVTASLRTDFGIKSPSIAVLGLNPHAGEKGRMGREEERIIGPALEKARRMGIHARGPFPADGFFGSGSHRSFDAVLAMYHDQGLIPLKLTGFDTGVNFTAGLPIVRTSPDHGTAFDIAGKGLANPGSMIEAIRLAVSVIANRRRAGRLTHE